MQYNVLKHIGGESGRPLDAEVQKIYMRSVCDNIFAEQLQTKMTWTGKTNTKSVKKIALQNCKKVIELIYGLAAAADKTIDSKMGKNLIVYSVLKYAYRNAMVDVGDTSANTSHSTTAASTNDTSVKTCHNTTAADPIQNLPVIPSANNGISLQQNPPNPTNEYYHCPPGPTGPYSDAYHHYPRISHQQQPASQFHYQHQQYQNPMMTAHASQNVSVPPQLTYHQL